MMNKVSRYLVIIPTYNEKENIEGLISEILKQDNLIEVLIIDDNSPDGTGEIVDNITKTNKRVQVMHRAGKLGLGSAYVAGFKYALKNNYDLIFQMDGDFSHDPKYLPKLIVASRKYDLTLGSRWTKGGGVAGWPWYRYVSSWGANLVARTLLTLKPRDITTGFRCYNKRVLQKINLDGIVSSGYAFLEELIFRTQKAGFSIGEIPIIFVDRKAGKSKMGLKEITSSGKAIFYLFIRRKGVGQFVKFGIVGFSSAMIDWAVFYGVIFLFHPYYLYAKVISFVIAVTNSYTWNRRWTFRSQNQQKMHEFSKFMVVAIIGLSLNTLIMFVAVEKYHLRYIYGLIFATGIVTFWNFFVNKYWTFKG